VLQVDVTILVRLVRLELKSPQVLGHLIFDCFEVLLSDVFAIAEDVVGNEQVRLIVFLVGALDLTSVDLELSLGLLSS
jgi:hypothetical protein